MGVLFCPHCFKLFRKEALIPSIIQDDNNIPSVWYPCPNAFCTSFESLVEIDENILPIVMKLNEKGFITKACCAGHFYQEEIPNCYIAFAKVKEYKNYITKESIPKRFEIEYDTIEGSIIIRKNIEYDNLKHFLYDQRDGIDSLLEWSTNLIDLHTTKEGREIIEKAKEKTAITG
jgi:hypothetical protein